MSQLTRTERPRARREHTCDLCRTPIQQGEQYELTVWMCDGAWGRDREHIWPCASARSVAEWEWGDPRDNEGLPPEEIIAHATERVVESDDPTTVFLERVLDHRIRSLRTQLLDARRRITALEQELEDERS